MFRELITNPIDPIPVEYINSLARIANEPDYSLTSLAIALLKPRIENYSGIRGKYWFIDNEIDAVNDFIEGSSIDAPEPMFCYYIYGSPSDEAEKTLKDAGFNIKQNVGTLIKEKGNVKCVAAYHKEKNIAAVFMNTRDMRYYHLTISFLSLYFPKIFETKPLQPQDYELVKACGKTDKSVFIQRIQEAVQPYILEFRTLMLNSLLKAMHQGKINRALEEVDEQRRYLDNVMSTWADANRKLRMLTITYEGLKATEQFDEAEDEFVEYLSDNKSIHNLTMSGTEMYFTVDTVLNNFNSDVWQTFSERGYIYDGNYARGGGRCEMLRVFDNKDNRKKLLDSIFSENAEFAIKMAGNYRIDFEENRVKTERNYDYINADPVFKNCIPNPHLKIFSCLGGYEYRISDELRNRNYIGAIELCCASAGSVNLEETEQTFRPFLGWVLSSREKILRRKDGTEMTPEEAIVYLVDKEKEE